MTRRVWFADGVTDSCNTKQLKLGEGMTECARVLRPVLRLRWCRVEKMLHEVVRHFGNLHIVLRLDTLSAVLSAMVQLLAY